MVKLQGYTNYRQSSIKEFNEIPSSWDIVALKRLLKIRITDGPHETPDLIESGIPFISADAIKNGRIDFNRKRGYISVEDHNRYSRKCKPQYGDIFMVKSGATTGTTAYVDTNEDFSIWSPLALIRCNENVASKRYVYYFLSSISFLKQVETNWNYGTQQNIGMGILENLYLAIPTKFEQDQITSFLNDKTSEIDALIADKEKLIELLEEKRQAIITETVTKGLDPDVKMKDSGVRWVGEIPKHWNVKRIKYFTKIHGGFSPEVLPEKENGVNYYKVDDLNSLGDGLYLEDSNQKVILPSNVTPINYSTILIPKRGAAIFTNKVRVSSDYCIFDSNIMGIEVISPELSTEFLSYFLLARRLDDIADTSTLPQINKKHINPLVIPLPNIHEQKQIVNFLQEFLGDTETLIDLNSKQINLLREYRHSLIYEAVTGKIDVRDYKKTHA